MLIDGDKCKDNTWQCGFMGGIGGTRVFNVILISFSCGVGLIARLHVKKNNDMYEDVLSGSS